jgi:hypothetical protein
MSELAPPPLAMSDAPSEGTSLLDTCLKARCMWAAGADRQSCARSCTAPSLSGVVAVSPSLGASWSSRQ